MKKFQSHKELLVWQKGISLVKQIYLLCGKATNVAVKLVAY